MVAGTEAARRVKEIALRRGASACGLAAPDVSAEYPRFASALEPYPAPLAYLKRGLPKRKDMNAWFPGAASVLVCSFPYWNSARERAGVLSPVGGPGAHLAATGRRVSQPALLEATGAKLARYASGPDYHRPVTEKLEAMLADIRAVFPAVMGRPFCDTSPVMEKELGRLAGLGFRGRNTLLISPAGSWFFLGGLVLDLPLPPDAPAGGDCGTCRLCEEACPTGALAGGKLSPEKCLSYWTTQARESAPPEIVEAARRTGYAYGCDLCQEVCPHNRK